MTEKHITHSPSETLDVAHAFARTIAPGTVIALSGELGTGKTVFARGVARCLGVREKVTSPTFTLINEYKGKIVLYHMDFYRLNSLSEIEDIGVDDYFFSDGICLVEWAEKMGKLIPENAVRVLFRHIDKSKREIIIERPDGK